MHPSYHPATLMFYCVTGCHPLWRRTVFDRIGLFDAGFTAPGDYEFLLRFAQAGLRAVRVPEVLSLFYQNPDGLSFQRDSKADREFKRIQAKYRAEMPIQRLYRVDPAQPASAARGWVALGNLALRHEVPWFDNVAQDADYARRCYTTALELDSQNVAARHNLALVELLRGEAAQAATLLQQLPAVAAERLRQSIQAGRLQLLEENVPAAVEALEFGGPPVRSTAEFALKMSVRWLGSFFEHGGESRDARAFVDALARRLELGALDVTPAHAFSQQAASSVGDSAPLRAALRGYPMMRGGISVSDASAPRFQRPADAVYAIGRTGCGKESLPPDWARLCNLMDEIWVGDQAQRDLFARGGVEADKLVVVADASAALARLREIEHKLLTPSCPPVLARTRATETVPSAKDQPPIQIAWEGSFLDLGSLSHVNRELTRELARQPGAQVECIGKNGLPPALAVMAGFPETARRLKPHSSKGAAVTVRHAWPPSWEPPAHGAWVLIQPWEFGALPMDWTRQLGRVDEVWAPSEYVRRVYVDSGVAPDKVKVVPNGIDPQRFRPEAPPLKLATGKTYKFLFVGGTIQRRRLRAEALRINAIGHDLDLVRGDAGIDINSADIF
jgi:hypothetical protein